MGFSSYRDIDAWRKARILTGDVYQVTRAGGLRRDFGLRDQMQRSAVSVMSNIAEGFGRGGNREFIHFLSQARASALELQSHFYVAYDVRYISEQQFDALYDACSDVIALISGLIGYLNSSDRKGYKFNDVD